MTKPLTVILLFITTIIYGQDYSGKLRIRIEEKVKSVEGRKIIANDLFKVVLNDTITFSLTTDNEGYVAINNLSPGKYSVKITRLDCQAYEVKGIMIGVDKTAYTTVQLTCASYIKSLTKKEKKKLGYK